MNIKHNVSTEDIIRDTKKEKEEKKKCMLNNQKIRIILYAYNLFEHIHSFFFLRADLMRLDTRVYTKRTALHYPIIIHFT